MLKKSIINYYTNFSHQKSLFYKFFVIMDDLAMEYFIRYFLVGIIGNGTHELA